MLLTESLQNTFDQKNFLETLDACKHYMFMANRIDSNFKLNNFTIFQPESPRFKPLE